MSDQYYRLDVSYDARHWSEAVDEKIAAVIGKQAEGSGAGFGMRDLEFYFDDYAAAQAAQVCIVKARLDFLVSSVIQGFPRR